MLASHAYVPKPMISGAKADGRFNNDALIYDTAKNECIWAAGETLIWRFSSVRKGLKLYLYWSSHCQECELKSKCTPSKQRRVRRWEHEAVSEEMQNRLSNAPEMMRIRKRTVEHPFGTLKQWMGGDTLPDPKAQRGECRDELEGACLQPETGHENLRHQWLDESVNGLKNPVFFTPFKGL